MGRDKSGERKGWRRGREEQAIGMSYSTDRKIRWEERYDCISPMGWDKSGERKGVRGEGGSAPWDELQYRQKDTMGREKCLDESIGMSNGRERDSPARSWSWRHSWCPAWRRSERWHWRRRPWCRLFLALRCWSRGRARSSRYECSRSRIPFVWTRSRLLLSQQTPCEPFLSYSLSICQSISPSIYLSISTFLYQSTYRSIFLYLLLSLSFLQYILRFWGSEFWLHATLFLCLSLSTRLSIYPSSFSMSSAHRSIQSSVSSSQSAHLSLNLPI